MTKKKTITFRRQPAGCSAEPTPLGRFFRGKPAQDDADLDPDLASIIQIWRAKYARFYDPSFNPDLPSVEATLRALTGISSGNARQAVRGLDPHTYGRLKHAANSHFMQLHPEAAHIPAEALGRTTIESNVQRFAELAHAHVIAEPKDKGGAPRISELDRQFAVELVSHWNRRHPDEPATVSNPADEPNAFEAWGWEMLDRAGRRANREDGNALREASIPRILSAAIKAVR